MRGCPCAARARRSCPVAVYGNRHYDDAVLELKTLGEAAGCVTLGAAAFVAQHCLNPDMGRGRPDASDLAVMKRFGSALRAKADGLAGSMPPLSVPGAFPYKEYKPTPFAPELLDAETCIRCGLCARTCPVRIIDSETYAVTEPERCLFCFGCVRICPVAVRGRVPKSRPCSPLKWRDWQPDVRSAASRNCSFRESILFYQINKGLAFLQ